MKNAVVAGVGVILLVLVIVYAIIAPRSAVQAPTDTQQSVERMQKSSSQTQADDSVNIKMTPAPSITPVQ